MRVIVERNAHAQTRGNAPELVCVNVATRLAIRHLANPGDPDAATPIGRDLLARVDVIPGVETVRADRHRLVLTIAKAFDASTVLDEVLDAVTAVVGEPLS